ncbi:MAG: hypothetical protein GY777_03495 [Candidatus Brocadiaceae bacterium]|nr:hypothetical protein [Candidatus Brocadiaceae bacterium]
MKFGNVPNEAINHASKLAGLIFPRKNGHQKLTKEVFNAKSKTATKKSKGVKSPLDGILKIGTVKIGTATVKNIMPIFKVIGGAPSIELGTFRVKRQMRWRVTKPRTGVTS